MQHLQRANAAGQLASLDEVREWLDHVTGAQS